MFPANTLGVGRGRVQASDESLPQIDEADFAGSNFQGLRTHSNTQTPRHTTTDTEKRPYFSRKKIDSLLVGRRTAGRCASFLPSRSRAMPEWFYEI